MSREDDGDSHDEADVQLTQIVEVRGLNHPNQEHIGGPRLDTGALSPTAASTSVPEENFPLASARWQTRTGAVTAVLSYFNANNRSGKVMPSSSSRRVVIACRESICKSMPIKNDKIMAPFKGSDAEFPGVIAEVHSGRGTCEVLFDDGDIDRSVPLADVTAAKSRWKIDPAAQCQCKIILLKSKDKDADLPWYVHLGGCTLEHATMCGGEARYTARTVMQLEAFTSAVSGNKAVTKKSLLKALEPQGVSIARSTLNRAKNAAAGTDVAAYKKSFQSLLQWESKFNSIDGGAHGRAEVRLDDDGHFVGMTVCYRSMLELCSSSPINVTAMDMASSKHQYYRGVHFILVGYDADNHVCILGWGVGPIEDGATYKSHFRAMFAMEAMEGSGGVDTVTFQGSLNAKDHVNLSDRMKGIPNVQRECIPLATAKWCVRHLIGNARADKAVINTWHDNQVWAIAKADDGPAAEAAFADLRLSSPTAEAYFRKIPVDMWCIWATATRAAVFGKTTSNQAESCNSQILPMRAEAPLDAADQICMLAMSKPYEWLQEAKKRQKKGEVLTAYAAAKVAEQDQLSRYCTVAMSTDTCGFVTGTRGQRRRFAVDLSACTCQCNDPYQFKLPCRHLIAAAKKQGLLARGKSEAWYRTAVHGGYFLDTYIGALTRISEVTRVKLVDLHGLSKDDEVKPNVPAVQAGRPRKKRIRSRGEQGGNAANPPVKKYKCSRCGVVGHNAATCTELM